VAAQNRQTTISLTFPGGWPPREQFQHGGAHGFTGRSICPIITTQNTQCVYAYASQISN